MMKLSTADCTIFSEVLKKLELKTQDSSGGGMMRELIRMLVVQVRTGKIEAAEKWTPGKCRNIHFWPGCGVDPSPPASFDLTTMSKQYQFKLVLLGEYFFSRVYEMLISALQGESAVGKSRWVRHAVQLRQLIPGQFGATVCERPVRRLP
jgi:hypothetical protein